MNCSVPGCGEPVHLVFWMDEKDGLTSAPHGEEPPGVTLVTEDDYDLSVDTDAVLELMAKGASLGAAMMSLAVFTPKSQGE